MSSDDIKSILRQLFVTHAPDRPHRQRAAHRLAAGDQHDFRRRRRAPARLDDCRRANPKSTAEYIQATSRVGRDDKGPGLVITLYNWARPRDLSHYETFGHYHATFYRHVEPLSVTPFSERALDKGLTGVLVAAVRHGSGDWNANQSARNLNRPDDADSRARPGHRRACRGRHRRPVCRRSDRPAWPTERLDAWEQEAARRPESLLHLAYRR